MLIFFLYSIIGLLILSLCLLVILFFSPSGLKAAFTGAPFMPTPKSVIRKALKEAELKPNEKMYDLGSGTGKALIIAAKEFEAEAIGFEYARPLFYFSKINLFVNGIKKGNVYRKDFYQEDFSDADVIFTFLTPKAFKNLENKFKRELKPRTRIITYSSPLSFWKPHKIIPLEDKENVSLFLYVKGV